MRQSRLVQVLDRLPITNQAAALKGKSTVEILTTTNTAERPATQTIPTTENRLCILTIRTIIVTNTGLDIEMDVEYRTQKQGRTIGLEDIQMQGEIDELGTNCS